jgi:hypothetical protein
MSKNIEFSTMQLIVENAMRQSGLQGEVDINGNKINIENGWKESVTVNDQTFANPQNLQKIRDAIALAIVNALTTTGVGGSITTGNSSGSPTVDASSDVVINGDSSSPEAARVTDETVVNSISDPGMILWMAAVDTYLNTAFNPPNFNAAAIVAYTTAKAAILAAGGSVPPSSVTSKITTGSSTVRIGD